MSSLSGAARYALEELMQRGTYEYQSQFARLYVAKGREEGREEGRKEGLQQGLQLGLQQGREEGLYEGARAAVFEVLDARGLEVDAETRQRILACKELAQLKDWLRKAVTVESAQELFEPGPVLKPVARKAAKRGRSLKAPKPRSKR